MTKGYRKLMLGNLPYIPLRVEYKRQWSAQFRVEDNGVGIPDDHLPKILTCSFRPIQSLRDLDWDCTL